MSGEFFYAILLGRLCEVKDTSAKDFQNKAKI
jgi:hypothetical protein